jgi:alpha-D-xyloside xylohydrolase
MNIHLLLITCLLALCLACAASADSHSGVLKLDTVAPGVYHMRAGTPEAHTPTHYRTAPPRLESLAHQPAAHLPFAAAEIRFRTTGRGAVVEIPMQPQEQVYGFGLNTGVFNMTGRRVFIRTSDGPENKMNDSHAPVPFYVSTAGYGVYVDTARNASFYTGNVALAAKGSDAKTEGTGVASSAEELYRARKPGSHTMVIDIPGAKGVDVYFFAGPTMLDAVRQYNLFSGGGCLPPLWGLGVAYRGSGSFNAAESLALARQLREDKIPCDVWGLEPGWQSHAYSCTFTWNQGRFPDPDAFIQQMHGLHYHLNLWEHAFTHPDSPLYKPLLAHSGNYLVWNGLVPDFATEEARRLFADHHKRTLVDKGIDGFKLDECDNQPISPEPWSFPECSAFPSGLDGEQMHSLLGELYQQTLLSTLKSANLRSYGLVRSSYALAAPLPFVIYSDSYTHQDYVRGVCKSGFSGLLWTPELRDAGSVEELYRRTETIVFSAQTLVNAWYLKHAPWKQINKEKSDRNEFMPDAPEVTATVRKLLELRMSLIPYLYSAYADYHAHGTPPFRAVVMDYPDDANAWNLDDEYLVGPSLLVAPLFTGQAQRTVYLPAGDWYDFWTHEKIAGGRKIEIAKPLDQIPVFVKGNTLLPLAEPVPYVAPDTCFALTVTAFGNPAAPFVLYEDDGLTYDYEQGKQNRVELRWDGQKGALTRTGAYAGPPRYKVEDWKSL